VVRKQFQIRVANKFAALENLKMIARTYIGLGKTSMRIPKHQLKRA
jgi:hypothetical protein